MSGKGRKLKLPRFIPSGNENKAPRVVTVEEQKIKGLKECAIEVADALIEKIRDSRSRTDEMLEEIAKLHNDIQKKRIGFKTKLKCKKKEMTDKHHQTIGQIQSTTSVQMAENEKIASQIGQLIKELEELAKPKELVVPKIGKIDLSAKTNRILREREEEMKKKCDEEFQPFFKKLEEQHLKDIESLERVHQEMLIQIDEDCQKTARDFTLNTLITREEIRLQNRYETIMQKERTVFEEERDALTAQIKRLEAERDAEMQRITDETDEAIFQGEKMLEQKIEEIRSLVVEPVIEEIPIDYKITDSQEQQIRQKIEQDLKASFEARLMESVYEIAQKKDHMEKEMRALGEKMAIVAEQESQQAISKTKAEIEILTTEISEARERINAMKAEWNDMNQTRRDSEETIKVLIERTVAFQKKLASVNQELEQLKNVKEWEDHEGDEIQKDIDALGSEVTEERKRHIHFMREKKAGHESSLGHVKQRVEALKQGKDDLINKLRCQVRDTRRKAKVVQKELQTRMG